MKKINNINKIRLWSAIVETTCIMLVAFILMGIAALPIILFLSTKSFWWLGLYPLAYFIIEVRGKYFND